MFQPDCTETEKVGITGVYHVAYTYASPGDLFKNYEQLKAEGIMPYWCVHHGFTVSMYYADRSWPNSSWHQLSKFSAQRDSQVDEVLLRVVSSTGTNDCAAEFA